MNYLTEYICLTSSSSPFALVISQGWPQRIIILHMFDKFCNIIADLLCRHHKPSGSADSSLGDPGLVNISFQVLMKIFLGTVLNYYFVFWLHCKTILNIKCSLLNRCYFKVKILNLLIFFPLSFLIDFKKVS